jgi:hypothetical protein
MNVFKDELYWMGFGLFVFLPFFGSIIAGTYGFGDFIYYFLSSWGAYTVLYFVVRLIYETGFKAGERHATRWKLVSDDDEE